MPTILSHAVAAVAIGAAFAPTVMPRRWWLVGAVAAMAPDLDALGLGCGIPYGDFWGHRGCCHSLCAAGVLAGLIAGLAASRGCRWRAVLLYLFLAIAAHGVLDAATDGGLGIALFSPFDDARMFLPFRPIAVAPLGSAFFTREAFPVLVSEWWWVWVPSLTLITWSAWRHRPPTAAPPS